MFTNKYLIEDLDTINKKLLFEMASIKRDRTGLPFDIWVDDFGKDRGNTHNLPRIKFQYNKKLIPISINSENPKLLADIDFTIYGKYLSLLKKFIIVNYNSLMKHWKREISSGDLYLRLVGVDDLESKNRVLSWLENFDLEDIISELYFSSKSRSVKLFGNYKIKYWLEEEDVSLEDISYVCIDISYNHIPIVYDKQINTNEEIKEIIDKIK